MSDAMRDGLIEHVGMGREVCVSDVVLSEMIQKIPLQGTLHDAQGKALRSLEDWLQFLAVNKVHVCDGGFDLPRDPEVVLGTVCRCITTLRSLATPRTPRPILSE
jgi:hypothetical protein